MGSPENNFQTMQNEMPPQGNGMQKNPQMLGNALQKYGSGNETDRTNNGQWQQFMNQFNTNKQQYTQNQNYATPAGGQNTPYGLNPYMQGLNKPTNLQPTLPALQPQQPAQSIQY